MIARSLKQKFWNKRVNAKKEGINFNLSLCEFILLMEIAGIKESDLHIKGYHLSRYSDKGDYSMDNCRFIHYLDNYAEKKVSEKSRKASAENIRNYNKKKNDCHQYDDEKYVNTKVI